MGETSMPEERKFLQTAPFEPATFRIYDDTYRNFAWPPRLAGGAAFYGQAGAGAILSVALHAVIAASMAHATVIIVTVVVVSGLVQIARKLLSNYAEITRARSIAAIRRAAISGKITPNDAEHLIQADISTQANESSSSSMSTTKGGARPASTKVGARPTARSTILRRFRQRGGRPGSIQPN